MNSHNHLIKVIRAFWANRRDNACFISHMEDNGLFTLESENDDVETYYTDDNGVDHLQDGSLHCTCGAGNAIRKHIAAQDTEIAKYVDAMEAIANGEQTKRIDAFEDMENSFNAAIDFACDKADGAQAAMDFLVTWREGDWESLDREWPEFKLSDRLRNAQL